MKRIPLLLATLLALASTLHAQTTADNTPPRVVSLNRQVPLTQTISVASVTFRAKFSEQVNGVDLTDFSLVTLNGIVSGTISAVNIYGTSGASFDIVVTALTGTGDFRLDLKSSGTGITDLAGNAILTGFTTGQTYNRQAAPALTFTTIASNNATPTVAKTGDIITLNFTASEPIDTPVVMIAKKTMAVTAGSNNSYTASYTLTSLDASGLVPISINFTSVATRLAGTTVTNSTDGSSVVFDKTASSVLAIDRQIPLAQDIRSNSVTFRVTFSEVVSGVKAGDFTFKTVSGKVKGTVSSIAAAPVTPAGKVYDVFVSPLSDTGSFRLDLNKTGTTITDVAGNLMTSGFTSGQTYSLQAATTPILTVVSITSNNPTSILAKTADVVTLNFTASEAINTPVVTVANQPATVLNTNANNFTATYTTSGSVTNGIIPFTINFTSAFGTAGSTVTTTTNSSAVTFDNTSPFCLSIKRQTPLSQNVANSTVTYRALFSEQVSGVDASDFTLNKISGSVTGNITGVTMVGTAANTYDITVTGITGTGNIRADLNSTGTGISDAAGNSIANGFTAGETYSLQTSVPSLTTVTISSNNTTPSLAKAGDVISLKFTASEAINTPIVTIASQAVSVSSLGANSYAANYTVSPTAAGGIVPFSIDFSNTQGTAGAQVITTTNAGTVTIDNTLPYVLTINRQAPLTDTVTAAQVTYRINFNEQVAGFDLTDLTLVKTGSANGNISQVTMVDAVGAIYDITVSSITGAGSLQVNLNSASTGIADPAGNGITSGFNAGQAYTIVLRIPTLTSVAIASNNALPALAKPGDIITLAFTASEPINLPVVTIATKSGAVTATGANSYAASYTMVALDANGLLPFTIDFTNTIGTAGAQVTTTTNGSTVIYDRSPPTVISTTRQVPLSTTTNATSVTFRVVFKEKVTGVAYTDFTSINSGSVTATVAADAVTAIGSAGTNYDVVVSNIAGDGSIRLDTKATGTNIADAAGNLMKVGFTSGESYTISHAVAPPPSLHGFTTVTPLTPLDITMPTKDKPQAKVWKYNNFWWSVLSINGGTRLFRLDGTSWTSVLSLSSTITRADCRVSGDLVHMLLYKGASSNAIFYSVKYDSATNTYKVWNGRPNPTVNILMPPGSETATLVQDGTGRMWIATDATNSATNLQNMQVWWSDAPYNVWSAPIVVSTGSKYDDICALAVMPSLGKIGLFWSNQNTKRFGFKTHNDGDDPAVWSADEMPAAQSALNIGAGFGDDHMNIDAGSDGTLYVAGKTSYNTVGYAKLILLVRRPSGVWDNAYTITSEPEGTQPIVILNEQQNKLKVIYGSLENGGDIRYKESAIDNIVFGTSLNLISTPGVLYDYSTSTHQSYTTEIVILATNLSSTPNRAEGVIASDDPLTGKKTAKSKTVKIVGDSAVMSLTAYPNPVTGKATIAFTLNENSQYQLFLYNTTGIKLQTIQNGKANAGSINTATLDGTHLPAGLYLIKLQTEKSSRLVKLFIEK